MVRDRETWWAVVHRVTKSWTLLSDWTELILYTHTHTHTHTHTFNIGILITTRESEGNMMPVHHVLESEGVSCSHYLSSRCQVNGKRDTNFKHISTYKYWFTPKTWKFLLEWNFPCQSQLKNQDRSWLPSSATLAILTDWQLERGENSSLTTWQAGPESQKTKTTHKFLPHGFFFISGKESERWGRAGHPWMR